MSDVLRARIRECLTTYDVPSGSLFDLDELAAELLESVLPLDGLDAEPIWEQLIIDNPGRCMNCLCLVDDCGCCVGCGAPDADLIGSHGYWCAL